ncbi:MAG: membrane protein insertion efficiency factor YidD [Bdellovibrionales bacterium]|nr:membrane protein insertion efficiency factor YidD [Bdellovibrionales bacterium]
MKFSLKDSIESLLSKALLLLVSFYRAFLGGYFGGNCRFYPSCSHYALEVLSTQRPTSAIALILKRLMSCHPLSRKGGFDPPPHSCCERNP